MTTITTREPELFAGSRFTWHLTADQTAGQASLADVLVRPGAEPPVHVHAREDEAYIVLEGEVTFLRGSETIDVGPGEAVFLPRGLQHGFAVRTPLARLMVLCTPGGLETSFDRLSQPTSLESPPVPQGPPSDEEQANLVSAFEAAGVTFIGPPLSAMLAGADG